MLRCFSTSEEYNFNIIPTWNINLTSNDNPTAGIFVPSMATFHQF